jgi:hypothetical protein
MTTFASKLLLAPLFWYHIFQKYSHSKKNSSIFEIKIATLNKFAKSILECRFWQRVEWAWACKESLALKPNYLLPSLFMEYFTNLHCIVILYYVGTYLGIRKLRTVVETTNLIPFTNWEFRILEFRYWIVLHKVTKQKNVSFSSQMVLASNLDLHVTLR